MSETTSPDKPGIKTFLTATPLEVVCVPTICLSPDRVKRLSNSFMKEIRDTQPSFIEPEQRLDALLAELGVMISLGATLMTLAQRPQVQAPTSELATAKCLFDDLLMVKRYMGMKSAPIHLTHADPEYIKFLISSILLEAEEMMIDLRDSLKITIR